MVKTALTALALVAGAPLAAQQATTRLEPNETLLEVEAEGVVKAVPDQAEFSTAVTTDGRTAKEAMDANALRAGRLVAAIGSVGVPAMDQRTNNLSVRARYKKDKDGDDTDELIAFRASNRLSLTVRDISRAPAVLDALTKAGATEVEGPNFSFADDALLKKAARKKAVAAASMQAEDYASALGMRPLRVLRVSERAVRSDGGSDIVVTGSRAAAAPIRPGQQETRVTVWIDYALVAK